MDPRDPRIDPVEPTLSAQTPSLLAGSALLPLILAAAIILILILMYLPNSHVDEGGRHHQRWPVCRDGQSVTLAVDLTAGTYADPNNGASAYSGTDPVTALVAELRS